MLTYGIEGSQETQSQSADGKAVYVGGNKDGQSKSAVYGGKGKLNHVGIYIEDEMDFDKWVFNLGGRFDKYSLGGIYEGDFSQFSPKAKVSFQATDNLKLRAGYGRIFRGPQLGETLMLSNNSVQSENTKAMSGHNVELGLDYNLSDAFGADNAMLGFTAYRYNVDNYAHPTKNNSISPQGDMEIWGLETVYTMQKGNLGLNLSHTYVGGEGTDYEYDTKFDPITTKTHTFKLDADYRLNDQWSLNYNGQFVPGNKYTRFQNHRGVVGLEEVKRKGYGVHNIGVTYEPSALKGAKVNFGIDNVFDKKYTRHTAFGTHSGSEDNTVFEVGRNFKIDFSYKF